MTEKEENKVFMVYGSFKDPVTDNNFAVFRIPAKCINWRKEVIPAIKEVIKDWFTPGEPTWDKRLFGVDGDTEPPTLWNTKVVRKYDWNAGTFVEVKG
jgi:hypothetical protein